MICDRIVVGILDKSLGERLQLNAALTLDGCFKLVRGTHVVKKQQKLLAKHANDLQLRAFKTLRKRLHRVINYAVGVAQLDMPKNSVLY